MSSQAAWARQQDLVSDEKKGGAQGRVGMLKRRKKEEDRAETTGSIHWKMEPKLLLDSPAQQRL